MSAQIIPSSSGGILRALNGYEEMIEALEKTEAWVSQYTKLRGHEAAAEIMLTFIRAAIAKTKGPQP